MLTRILPLRALTALTAIPLALAACSSPAPRTDSAAPAGSAAIQSDTVTPANVSKAAGPLPAAPVAPFCGDVSALSTRDKLAQLLMVGVRDAADARAVVSDYRVGGIMIGSWTDLSMLTDGTLTDIGNIGPLPLAVSVDEEGGRVSRLSSLIGPAPAARTLAQTQTPDEVYQLALSRGRQMRGLGITIDFAPVVDVSDQGANTVIGDRSFSNDPATVTTYAGAFARGLRDAGLLPVLSISPAMSPVPVILIPPEW